MSNKLEMKGRNILKEQFYDREQTSRDETKLESGHSAVYNAISSKGSMIQHQKQWKPFAEFVTNSYKIKTLSKVELWMIVEFIQQEVTKGLAEKTLKARITAINHVMVGSGVWKENQKVSLSQLRATGNFSKQKGPTQVYKELTAEEWRERHKKEYDENQDIIDLTRAFGLRKCEIFGKDGGYKGLTLRNLGHMEGSQTLFAEVIGKGGKYRVAEVREDFSKQMWDKYGHICRTYSKDYFQKTEEERKKILKGSSKAKERIFQIAPRGIPLHIHRSEYVQEKLKERQRYYEKIYGKMTTDYFHQHKIGYSRLHHRREVAKKLSIFKIDYKNKTRVIKSINTFETVEIGSWRGFAIVAAEVSELVGHNRLDVLRKYM